MRVPPAACTFTIHTPSDVAAATAVRDGVRDVVELQVEEDAVAAARQRADDVRAFGGEEPAADLEAADDAAQRVGQRDRRRAVLDVERN